MHFTYQYNETSKTIEAQLKDKDEQIGWLQKSTLIDDGKTLYIGHFGITTTRLKQGNATLFLGSLKDEIKQCSNINKLIFAGIDLNKKGWSKFLAKYKAKKLKEIDIPENLGLIKGHIGLDSYSIDYSDIQNA